MSEKHEDRKPRSASPKHSGRRRSSVEHTTAYGAPQSPSQGYVRREGGTPSRSEEREEQWSRPTERIQSGEPFQEPDPALTEAARRPAKEFNLRINNELKRIPDYTRTVRRKPYARVRRKMTVFVKIMLALIILGMSVFLALAIVFTAQEVFGFSKESREIVVDIPLNAGVVQIADILEEKKAIKSAFLFKAYFKVMKPEANFQYGTYSLNSEMSYEAMVNELSKYAKSRDEIKVSFPEGFTLYQIANRLEENKVCKAKDFLEAVNSSKFGYEFEKSVSDNPLKFHRMEGYAFPDTYFFYENDSPASVAKKFIDNFDKRVDATLRARMQQLGYTLEETLVIASIVQEEAGLPEEMARVASVYSNRLKNPGVYPNLQADPTRGYAEELKMQMNVKDPEILAAYNTYEGAGLPPGPICNPGLDAIKATLYPEETDYFFFCTNLDTSLEQRRFYYAQTLEEHEQNLRKAGLV